LKSERLRRWREILTGTKAGAHDACADPQGPHRAILC
jgi:hypothetical protein